MDVLGASQKTFCSKKSSPVAVGRNRSSNRERHSKIFTAQGLRDRRMRLSIDVACKFFSLQDMLGFDKASETISWLMMKSKTTINELAKGLSQRDVCDGDGDGGENWTSEYGDISGLDETTANVKPQEKDLKQKSLVAAPKVNGNEGSKKGMIYPAAKESRRERTREKMIKRLDNSNQLFQLLGVEINEPNCHDLSRSRLLYYIYMSQSSPPSRYCLLWLMRLGPVDSIPIMPQGFVFGSL